MPILLIGISGFGKVYKVNQKINNRTLAIKKIDKNLLKKGGMKLQINKEIKIMYSLFHDNIVRLYNHFEDDNFCYLIMDLDMGTYVDFFCLVWSCFIGSD